MDSKLTVRFYRVSTPPAGVGDFGDVLLQALDLGTPADRERDIGQSVIVRLEGASARAQTVEGDLCRVQRTNIPPQAGADGLVPIQLNEGHGIGHMAAFLYHRPTRVLALQSNMQSVTPNRLSIYLASIDVAQQFQMAPVLTDDALERFQAGQPRKLTVKFSGIDRLDVFDDPNIPVAQGAKRISDAYAGIDVEITVSVGRTRDNALAQGPIMRTVNQLIGAPGIAKLTTKLEGDDQPLDLLHEQLKESDELDLPEGDPDRHYQVRRAFLRSAFDRQRQTIIRQFGDPNGNAGG